jgi:hypothetical protein
LLSRANSTAEQFVGSEFPDLSQRSAGATVQFAGDFLDRSERHSLEHGTGCHRILA